MVLLFVAPLMGLTGDQVAVQCLSFCLSLGMDTLQGAGEKEKISVESAHHHHHQHSVCEVQMASNQHKQKKRSSPDVFRQAVRDIDIDSRLQQYDD